MKKVICFIFTFILIVSCGNISALAEEITDGIVEMPSF